MSRTATCFIALGISIALAAACGDDGGGVTGAGGSGGSGGSTAGTGNNAGSAGTGETAGAAGTAGTGGAAGAGSGGSAGRAGTGGTAGTGGAAGSAGAGGAPPADAGPDGAVVADAAVDSGGTGGTAAVDSGVNGNCPASTTANVENGAQNDQSVAIAEVLFRAGSTADVVIQSLDNALSFSDAHFLCTGSNGDDVTCLDLTSLVDGGTTTLTLDQRLTVPIASVSVTGGELAITNLDVADPDFTASGQAFAYVAWGSFPPPGGNTSPLEAKAATEADFWTSGDRVATTGGQNALIATGAVALDSNTAAGFSACTGDDF